MTNDGTLNGGVWMAANTALTYTGAGSVNATGGTGILVQGFTVAPTGPVNITTDGTVAGSTGGIIVQGGAGLVTVVTNKTVSSTLGDGINLSGLGGINLTTNATVSGDPGVVLNDNSAVGITYNANADVSGLLSGILSTEANAAGATNITVATGKTVTAGNGAGISAVNTNTGGAPLVNVTLAGTASVKATGGDGVSAKIDGAVGLAQVTVGSGKVDVIGSGLQGPVSGR